MKLYVKSTDDVFAHPAIAHANLTPQMVKMLGTYHQAYTAGDNVFNLLHAYLQGLEDAGIITSKEHDDIFCEVMEID